MTTEGNGKEHQAVARRERRGELARPETFDDLVERMDEMMERMMEPWGFRNRWGRFPRFRVPAPRMAFEFNPAIDVFEREGNVVVRADVPGVKADDIDVSIEGDMLTIRGTRQEESEVKEQDYQRAERSFGEFTRTIRVPEGTQPEDIKASFKDGVLEVVAPKPKGAEPKHVKVETK